MTQILFINASRLGVMVTRVIRELQKDEIRKIADTVLAFRNGGFQGKVRIIYESTEFGPLRTEFFRLNSVPLMYLIDHLDCRILTEDYFHNCENPEDYEIQIGITAV